MSQEKKFKLTQTLKVVFLGLILGLGINVALAQWVPPGFNPTNCPSTTEGCNTPINRSAVNQIKDGSLGIGGILNVQGAIKASSTIYFDGDLVPRGMVPCDVSTGGKTVYKDTDGIWKCTSFAPSFWKLDTATVGDTNDITTDIARNVNLPNTVASGGVATAGVLRFGATDFLHNYGTNNLFLGANAGNYTMSGSVNTGIGLQSLDNNTSGSYNVAVGQLASGSNSSGSYNVAVGRRALNSNVSGSGNVAVGDEALFSNTSASSTAVGYQALMSNTIGAQNVAVGHRAIYGNINGNRNTGVGYQALSTGSGATFVDNTAVGWNSLASTTVSGYNTAMGSDSLRVNTTGSYNTALGYQSLFNNVDKGYNTAVGYQALYSNDGGAPFTAENNTAVGNRALQFNTAGQRNVAVGSNAMTKSDFGNDNVAIGYQALTSSTVSVNPDVDQNVAVGSNALTLANNDSADNNTAVGHQTLDALTDGNSNTALGSGAGGSVTTGQRNVFAGAFSGAGGNPVTTGGDSATGGNTLLGYGAGFAGVSTQYNNATAVGYQALVGASNAMVLGNDSVNVGIRTTAPGDVLQIGDGTADAAYYLRLDVISTSITGNPCSFPGRMILSTTGGTDGTLYVCGRNSTWRAVLLP